MYHQLLKGNPGRGQFNAVSVYDEDLKHAAKKLHASVYLSRGFISPEHIEETGIMTAHHDPHQGHSQYFVVTEPASTGPVIIATARQIFSTSAQGFGSFPILKLAKLYDAENRRIIEGSPLDYVEISGLAKALGVSAIVPLFLYRTMWHYSLEMEQKYWLMACDVRLYKRLKLLFGPSIRQIGDVSRYQGGDVVPAILDVHHSHEVLSNAMPIVNPLNRRIRRSVLAFFVDGLNDKHLPVEHVDTKKAGI